MRNVVGSIFPYVVFGSKRGLDVYIEDNQCVQLNYQKADEIVLIEHIVIQVLLFTSFSNMLHTMQLLLLATIVGMVRSSPYTSYQNQRFAMEPQDQTAVVGARVTLPCRVINKQGTLQWTKDDFGLGTSRDLSGFERYAMVGSDEEGDYSLDIYPVMLDDDARYQCQVSPGPEGQPAIRSTFAGLTVLVPPEAPKITQGDVIYATEDRKVEIECVSVGGKPAAEVSVSI